MKIIDYKKEESVILTLENITNKFDNYYLFDFIAILYAIEKTKRDDKVNIDELKWMIFDDEDMRKINLLPFILTIGNGHKNVLLDAFKYFYPTNIGYVHYIFYNKVIQKENLSKLIIFENNEYKFSKSEITKLIDCYKDNDGKLNSYFDNSEISMLSKIEKSILSINDDYNLNLLSEPLERLTNLSVKKSPIAFYYETYAIAFGVEVVDGMRIKVNISSINLTTDIDINLDDTLERISNQINLNKFLLSPINSKKFDDIKNIYII